MKKYKKGLAAMLLVAVSLAGLQLLSPRRSIRAQSSELLGIEDSQIKLATDTWIMLVDLNEDGILDFVACSQYTQHLGGCNTLFVLELDPHGEITNAHSVRRH